MTETEFERSPLDILIYLISGGGVCKFTEFNYNFITFILQITSIILPFYCHGHV